MNDQLQRALDNVRARFLEALDERIMNLAQMHEAVSAPGAGTEAVAAAAAEAHKIRGIALTIGFPELGRLAAEAEDSSGPARDGASPDVFVAAFDQMLDEMEKILDTYMGVSPEAAPMQAVQS